MITFQNFLFSNRSYTPIPIVFILLYFSIFNLYFFLLGLLLIIIGETIRISAVKYAGGVTRTTKVGAPILITEGPYSISRNPLYLGNMIIYSGVVILAGGPFVREILLFTLIFFIFQYYMIISLEERTLRKLFKIKYIKYCSKVPRLFPKKLYWNVKINQSNTILKTFKTERRTLQNIFLMISLILLKTYLNNIY